MTPATINAPRTPHTRSAQAAVVQHERAQPRTEEMGPFAELLAFNSTTRDRLRNQSQSEAAQMFEAKSADPQQVRRSRLREEYGDSDRQDLLSATDDHSGASVVAEQAPPPRHSRHDAGPTGRSSHRASSSQPTARVREADLPARASHDPPQGQMLSARRQFAESLPLDGTALRPSIDAMPRPCAVPATQAPATASPAQQLAEILRAASSPDNVRGNDVARTPQNVARSTGDEALSTKARPPQSTTRASLASPAQFHETTSTSFEETVRSLRLQLGARQSSARLRLQPPELGHLRVDVKMLGDRVRIDVQAETNAARDLLTQRVDQLKSGLESYGIRLERLEVVLNGAPAAPLAPAAPSGLALATQPPQSEETGRRPASHAPRKGMLLRSDLHAALDARLDVQG